jgi:hypothetical protein
MDKTVNIFCCLSYGKPLRSFLVQIVFIRQFHLALSQLWQTSSADEKKSAKPEGSSNERQGFLREAFQIRLIHLQCKVYCSMYAPLRY